MRLTSRSSVAWFPTRTVMMMEKTQRTQRTHRKRSLRTHRTSLRSSVTVERGDVHKCRCGLDYSSVVQRIISCSFECCRLS